MAPEGQYFRGLYAPVPAEDLVAAALVEVAAGARWVKLIADFPVLAGPDKSPTAPVPTYPIADLRRLVDAVHAAGARVAAHSTTVHVKSLIEAVIDSVEHGFGLDEADLADLAARGGGAPSRPRRQPLTIPSDMSATCSPRNGCASCCRPRSTSV